MLANARDLAPLVRDRADDIEAARQLPDDLYARLVETGAIRMAMPRAWGGRELAPLEQIEVIEVLAHADASVGWCTSILSDCGFCGAFLSDEAGRKAFANLDAACAGMLMPVGRAEPVEGGYRASGRWAFGSGCRHASWITGGCLIVRDGAVRLTDQQRPEWRVLIFAPEDVEILDTWHVTGLAGSGSHDYQVTDAFVPAERSFDLADGSPRSEPLYGYHGNFFANVPGIPLGIARRALEEARGVAETKLSPPNPQPLVHDARVQALFAEAEGLRGAARSYCWDVMGGLWDTLCTGETPSLELRARVALMIVHVARSSQKVVDLACEIAGSTALYRRSPLERLRRDMIAVGSHLVHQRKIYGSVGRALFGLPGGVAYF